MESAVCENSNKQRALTYMASSGPKIPEYPYLAAWAITLFATSSASLYSPSESKVAASIAFNK